MVTLNALIFTTAILGGAPAQDAPAQNTVLLHFTAKWCKPCQLLEPTIRRISNEGYPLRSVDIDQRPDLAKRFNVGPVPTFVLVTNGQEVSRAEGARNYRELVDLMGGSRVLPQSPAGIKTTIVRGQSPATGASASRTGLEFSKRETAAVAALTPAAVRRRAMAATVRLRVDDGDAFSYGTGTIVDVHQGEALILTCGHIFRDSRGKGAIEVDVFAGGAMRKVRGQLITYEPDYRDIGFVSFRSPVPLQPAPVAAQPNAAQPGAAAFSIGCDRGADPSIRETRVTTINRFQGAPNIETSGAPVLGRSGGGLFNNNGELIGVCKLAVPSDDEGIYSSLPSIHWHLDKLNLAHVYQRSIAQPVESTAPPMFAGTRADDRRSEPQSRQQRLGGIRDVVADSSELPRTRPAIDGAISSALSAAGDAEVICIIRRRNDPQGRSRIVRVDQASPELLAEIARAAQARSPSASLDRASRPLETAGRFDMPPVVRAQSGAESLKP